jgi:hypothetical protein
MNLMLMNLSSSYLFKYADFSSQHTVFSTSEFWPRCAHPPF